MNGDYEYCDVSKKCRNRGKDCEHCTRSYDYEEAHDYFDDEWDEGEEKEGANPC
jgi:hypothetical protein